jgi:fructokinase
MRYTPVCIFGEVLLDCFPDGRRIIGGAPFNVAWHLSAFGETPYFCSAVGDDPEGHAIRDAMTDWGMDPSGVRTDPEHPTGQVEVSGTEDEPAFTVLPRRAFDHIRQLRGGVRCDLLYHGTLALREPDSAHALEALKAGSPKRVFLDVNLRAPWWSLEQTLALVTAADWVKLNQAEFGLLTGRVNGAAESDLAERAAEFREQHGLTGLVVTLGAAGALAVTAGEGPLHTVAAVPSRLVDTVGAGDAFAAVLILGIRHDWGLVATLDRANQFAARIVAQPGATAADPGLYEPFIDAWGLAPEPAIAPPAARPAAAAPKRRGPGRPRRV